jgi:hypothetical protein
MCQAVEEYVNERAKELITEDRVRFIKNLMTNLKWSLNQAMDALNIPEEERATLREKI